MARPEGLILTDSDRRKLIVAREKLALTQGQLAERVGVDRVTVNQIERGQRNPSWQTLSNLAEMLDLEAVPLIRRRKP